MHDQKLNELVQYVRKNSAFYGELYESLPEKVTDVTQLPLIDHASGMRSTGHLVWARTADQQIRRAGPELPGLPA